MTPNCRHPRNQTCGYCKPSRSRSSGGGYGGSSHGFNVGEVIEEIAERAYSEPDPPASDTNDSGSDSGGSND